MVGAADENVHLANTKLMTRGMALSDPVIFTRPFSSADTKPADHYDARADKLQLF